MGERSGFPDRYLGTTEHAEPELETGRAFRVGFGLKF